MAAPGPGWGTAAGVVPRCPTDGVTCGPALATPLAGFGSRNSAVFSSRLPGLPNAIVAARDRRAPADLAGGCLAPVAAHLPFDDVPRTAGRPSGGVGADEVAASPALADNADCANETVLSSDGSTDGGSTDVASAEAADPALADPALADSALAVCAPSAPAAPLAADGASPASPEGGVASACTAPGSDEADLAADVGSAGDRPGPSCLPPLLSGAPFDPARAGCGPGTWSSSATRPSGSSGVLVVSFTNQCHSRGSVLRSRVIHETGTPGGRSDQLGIAGIVLGVARDRE